MKRGIVLLKSENTIHPLRLLSNDLIYFVYEASFYFWCFSDTLSLLFHANNIRKVVPRATLNARFRTLREYWKNKIRKTLSQVQFSHIVWSHSTRRRITNAKRSTKLQRCNFHGCDSRLCNKFITSFHFFFFGSCSAWMKTSSRDTPK